MAIDDLIIKSQYALHVQKLCSKQGFFYNSTGGKQMYR